jgi:hypothetical protein
VFQQKIEMDRKALQTGAEVVPNLSDFIVNYFSAWWLKGVEGGKGFGKGLRDPGEMGTEKGLRPCVLPFVAPCSL